MDKKTCVSCGSRRMVHFEGETDTVSSGGLTTRVEGLSGWRCQACEEVQFDQESAQRFAAAGDALVMQARLQRGEELRRIRKKLNLTQVEAELLTGGGHNAFSRYERGKANPGPAVINLFKLLDNRPDRLKELV